MRPARLAGAALVLALLVPSVAQEDRKPYFSLASNRTWLPGEKPTIQMWSQNVSSLEYRIYKVKDPAAFFGKMEDSHRFGPGMAVPRKKREITLIERIHRFKKSFRDSLRDSVRGQFSGRSRSVIHGWMAGTKPPAPSPATTRYAGLPVLNPQQLVATFQQAVPQARRWESQTIPIDVKERGVYLVEAAKDNLRAYTIVIVSEMAILAKTAPSRVVASVVDARSGAAIEGSAVRAQSGPQVIAEARTSPDGLAEFKIPDPAPDNLVLTASRGGDFTASGIDSWSISSDPERTVSGYVYTDRPIYRPGHTVHVKAIVRRQTPAGWEMPENSRVTAEINDPEGKTVFRKDTAFTSMGTVQFDYELPPGAALGYYSVQFHAGGEFSGGFQVEEYKKPEYEVRVNLEPRRVLQGQSVQATLSARYFFGEPVKNAKVTWVVHRYRYWYPAYAEDPEDTNPEDADAGWGGEQVSEESGQLDADGVLKVRIPTAEDGQPHDMRYRVEARVTDAANREISGAASALATRGSFLVHIEAGQYVLQPGDEAAFTVEARDYDGHPVQTPVRVELREWRGKGGEMAASVQAEARTGEQGSTKVTLKAASSGSFRATVVARTPEGREVQDQTWIWVTGSAGGWYSDRRERLQLVPDKKSYRPGDRARILIVTGTPSARVLVTAEGAEILSRQIVEATSPAVTVEVPVKKEYAPNFYVTAAFIRDNHLYEGTRKIRVPASDRQLQVEVTPSKREYRPGEQAIYNVTTRDAAGKPVSAELSLGVVDEAIYAIRPDTTQDIFRFFYGVAPNRVGTNTSLNYYFSGEAGTRRMQLAGLRSRRNLAQLKPEALLQPKVRKAFPDTAYWMANLTTGPDGAGQARFEWPDALTTWRATARAVTRDTMAGSATDKVIVRKNLMVRLSAPRFFTEGDQVTVSLLVHNYLKSDKTARVSLEAKGLDLLDAAPSSEVRVPSGGDAKIDYRVRARRDREAVLTAKALTNEESDALEITLPVNPFGVKLARASSGSLAAASAEQGIDLAIPDTIQPGSQSIELRVAPSVAGAIFGALEYLTRFPYGCTEQTMSSFLPNIMVSQALRELKVPSRVDSGELRQKIDAGLERLYGFQHQDGGWGWWESDESHPFMTAYVVSGLAQARAAGQSVRGDAVDRGRAWIRARLHDDRRIKADLRAYLVYALSLAGEKDRGVLDAAWESQDGITAYGLALLGLALKQAGDPRAAELASRLESAAASDGQVARWEVPDDNLMEFHGDTSVEATAFALKLLTATRPASPLLEQAAYWLVARRGDGYYWNSTKQTAMAIYGLIDYVKLSRELKPNFTVTVSKADRQLLSRRFTETDVFATEPPVIRLSAADVAAGSNPFKITKSGQGRLYWSARAEYYSAGEQLSGSGSAALNVSREYFRLVPVQDGARIVHQLEPLAGPLAPGDVVAVRLVVSGGPWRYLLTEDPIPSGAEFVTRDDLYQIRNKPPWWHFAFTRREFRDDRAALFQTWFGRETLQQIYLLKVVNPGVFRISPARVQPMYQPQFLATTSSRVLEVR